ncbi:hypothetical protein PMIN02_012365 [Paraphaeosphaeria minitans]
MLVGCKVHSQTERVYPSSLCRTNWIEAIHMLIKTVRKLWKRTRSKRSLTSNGIQVCCTANEATNGNGMKENARNTDSQPIPPEMHQQAMTKQRKKVVSGRNVGASNLTR